VSVLRPCNVRELLGRPTHFSSDAAAATAMQDVRHQSRYAACRSTRPRIKGATPVADAIPTVAVQGIVKVA
jgi:hypothetical protein